MLLKVLLINTPVPSTCLVRNLLMRIGRKELPPFRGCDAEFLMHQSYGVLKNDA